MPTLNLGRVGFVNKGTWLISTAYKINDTVTYLGGTYACLIANTGQTPILGGTIYWQEWVSEDTVHRSGIETITGLKTFSLSPIIPNATTAFQPLTFGQFSAKLASDINSATAKTTPVDADKFGIWDSISGLLNSVSLLNLKNTIFSSPVFTGTPTAPVPTVVNQLITMGNIREKTGTVIGYDTGSGGTVTQATSKSTAVTLNKPTGRITMNNAALAASSQVSFSFINSFISTGDCVLMTLDNLAGTPSAYLHTVSTQGSAATVTIRNTSTGSLSEALIINFAIIKGAIA